MKLFLTILFQLIIISNCLTQVSEEWVKKLNGSGNSSDAGNAMVIDASGNIIVTGYTTNTGTGKDIVTIKYSPTGQVIWTSYFNGSMNRDDDGRYIAIDNAGNIYVAGRSDSVASTPNFITIKYNSAGVLQWANRYAGGGPGNGGDVVKGIALDNSSNIYVTGSSFGNGTSIDIAVIKYNSSGVVQWLVRYDTAQDEASGIVVDTSSNIYVSGYSSLGGSMAFALIKFNSSGQRQWVRNYSTPGVAQDVTTGIALDYSGNIFITGYGFQLNDFITLKYTPSGVQEWINTYNGTAGNADQPTAIQTDGAGNVYVTGGSPGIGSQSDIALVKYSNSGSQIWAQRFNGLGNSNDFPVCLTVLFSNIFITGRSIGFANSDDCVSLLFDSSGTLRWQRYYDGTAALDDRGNSIKLDNTGNIYVTGYSYENGRGTDLSLIKYSQITRHDFVTGPIVNLPAVLYTNSAYSINTRIYNNSTTAESNVPVNFYINSTLVNTANISLFSGEADTLSNIWTPTVPGTYELKYVSSLSNDIDRSNDTVKINVQVINPPGSLATIRICRNGLNRFIPSGSATYDTIFINIPNAISVLDVNVKIDTVLFDWDADLRFQLSHLSAIDTMILYRGGSGDNFIGTNLNDSASIPISSGTAPFTGTYRPDRPLSKFNTLNPNGMWILRISADAGGETGFLKAWCIEIQYDHTTGITNTGNIPQQFSLSQNYPNPFNPATKIRFEISGTSPAHTSLSVHDILGREMEMLVNKELSPGTYEVDFDGSKYASGIYFYSLVTPQFSDIKKMLIVK
jgi:uncharacterized delta-60 repeat protein